MPRRWCCGRWASLSEPEVISLGRRPWLQTQFRLLAKYFYWSSTFFAASESSARSAGSNACFKA